MSGYPDYQAVAEILAAIGTPAQGTGSDSIASMLTSLGNILTQIENVVTQTTDTVTQVENTVTQLENVIAQIQTGTPALINPVSLFNLNAQVLAGTTGYNVAQVKLTGTSYSLTVTTEADVTGSTKPFLDMQLVFEDANGNTMQDVQYDLPIAANGTYNRYVFNGPSDAQYLTVKFYNYDSVAVDWSATCWSTNIPATKHTMRSPIFTAPPGYTLAPFGTPAENVLTAWSDTLASGGTLDYILPPYSGDAIISLRAYNSPSSIFASMYALYKGNSFLGTGGVPIWGATLTDNAAQNFTLILPNGATMMHVQNTETGSDTITAAVTSSPG